MSERLLPRTEAERTARIWQPADLMGARGSASAFTPAQWRPSAPRFEASVMQPDAAPESELPFEDEPADELAPEASDATAQALPAPPVAEPGVSQQALEDARLEAYAEGEKFGRHEAEKQFHETRQSEQKLLHERIASLDTALKELAQSPERLHEPLKRLALHLAEQLVLGELGQSPQAIERLVRRCVEELGSRRSPVLIELHPDDLALLQPWLHHQAGEDGLDADPARTAAAALWQLQANEHLRPGSVRASAEDAVVSDLIEHRLDALARQLLLDPQRQARQSAFAPERLAARRADVDAVLDAQPRMAEAARSKRFSPVVEAEPVISAEPATPAEPMMSAEPATPAQPAAPLETARMPDPAPPPESPPPAFDVDDAAFREGPLP